MKEELLFLFFPVLQNKNKLMLFFSDGWLVWFL